MENELRVARDKFDAIYRNLPDVPLDELTPTQLAELQLAIVSIGEVIERHISKAASLGWDNPNALRNVLQKEIAELEAKVNPMLGSGANPDDNEELRHKMADLESLRRLLENECGENE